MQQHGQTPSAAPLEVAGANLFDAVARQVVVEGLAFAAAAERLAASGTRNACGAVGESWLDQLICTAGANHVTLASVEKNHAENMFLMMLHSGSQLPVAAAAVLRQPLFQPCAAAAHCRIDVLVAS
jgi:hypothetical protein